MKKMVNEQQQMNPFQVLFRNVALPDLVLSASFSRP